MSFQVLPLEVKHDGSMTKKEREHVQGSIGLCLAPATYGALSRLQESIDVEKVFLEVMFQQQISSLIEDRTVCVSDCRQTFVENPFNNNNHHCCLQTIRPTPPCSDRKPKMSRRIRHHIYKRSGQQSMSTILLGRLMPRRFAYGKHIQARPRTKNACSQ